MNYHDAKLPMNPRVLIVEDDRITSARLAAALQLNDIIVLQATSIEAAQRILAQKPIDILILDIELPDGSGLELIDSMRSQGKGIICVSVKGEKADRLTALQLGADDYIVKPAASEELIVKIRNLYQRVITQSADADNTRHVYCFADWLCDPLARTVQHVDGSEIPLTPGEFSVLMVFLRQPKACLSRDKIMTHASSQEHVANDRAVDIMVHRLRKKFTRAKDKPEIFVTIYGEGYLFNLNVTASQINI